MKHIFTRPAEERDVQKFLEWSQQNPHFDAKVLGYKTTTTFVAYDGEGPVAFVPVQQPLCMEAMAFRPGTSNSQKAAAMKELTHFLITLAHMKGAGELIFLGSNEGTNQYAEYQAFTQLPWKLYRIRVAELEGQKPELLEAV